MNVGGTIGVAGGSDGCAQKTDGLSIEVLHRHGE